MTYIPGGGGGSGSVGTSADVALNNPTTGQVLTYDESVGKWINGGQLSDRIADLESQIRTVQMTQAEYDALATKDPNKLYIIVG